MIKVIKKIKFLSFPKISFHPLFIGYLTYLFMCSKSMQVIVCILSLFLHETGHLIMAKKIGKQVGEIVFYPYGAVIEEDEIDVKKDEWKVALSGPLISLILFIISGIIVLFIKNNFWIEMVNVNLTIFLFNLLPVYPLDGARAILSTSKKPIKLIKYLRLSGIGVSIVLIAIFIITAFFKINYSFLIMGVFLFIGSTRGIEREMSVRVAKTLLSTEKQYKKGVEVVEIAFDGETPIHKVISKFSPTKLTDISIIQNKERKQKISEKELLEKATKITPNTKLKEIV